MNLCETILKTVNLENEEFRELMGMACWSAAETARRLGVSESSISAYVNNNQVPPQTKIILLRLLVDKFMNTPPGNEHTMASANKPDPGHGPAVPPAAAQKKSLREIRLEALLIRIETLAAGLRFFDKAEEKVDAAEELAGLASELAKKLQSKS
jgi:transcriptional regulator with XRE-family HTH domain